MRRVQHRMHHTHRAHHGMGRPPLPEPTIRKTVGLPERLWAEVAEYRFEARVPTVGEAVRRLVELGLAAAGARRAVSKRKRRARG
jgi:hypothetical protein